VINITTIETPVYTKRIHGQWDENWKIVPYDLDNIYPQRMKELRNGSPYAKSCTNVIKDFLNGEGFTSNGDTVVNDYGQTWDDILDNICGDYSIYQGFSLHLNFNGLGNIIEVQHLPFEYVRFGMPDKDGAIKTVKVWDQWEYQGYYSERPNNTVKPKTYNLFNPLTAGAETLMGGRGQVLYFTPYMFCYPLATFDAVRDTVQTDAEIQRFMLKNIQNGFLSTTLFKYPGTFDSKEERNRIEEKIKNMKGSNNANTITLIEAPEDFNQNLIEQVPANNNDRLFEQTGAKVRDMIIHNSAIPPALIGVMPDTGVFTQQAIRDSYIYMNTRTKTPRRAIERVFDKISPLFGSKVGKIKPNEFDYAGNPEQENQFTEERDKSNSDIDNGRTDNNSEN
jgi:hypothetical protein